MVSAARQGMVCVVALVSGAAHAQQSDALESITVWAQKRESALADVPLTVTALSGEALSSGGLSRLADIAERLPSLDLQSTASLTTTSLRLRRVGNLGNIPTFEPAVGLFVDGAFRSRSLLGTGDLLDVERVEIISGPQSTLYGKSVSAGVFAVYTRTPGEQFEATAEATSGSIDSPGSPSLLNLKLALSGPLSSDLRAGVAASHSRRDHTIANALANSPDGDDENRFVVRGQLQWSPNERLDVRVLAGYAQQNDDQGESDVFLHPGTPSRSVADALLRDGFGTPCGDNTPRNRTTCSIATNTLDFEAVDLTLLASYRLANGWMLTSVSAWDRYEALRNDDDTIQMSAPVLFYHDSEEGASIQEELRLTSSEGPTQWLAGAFYYRHDHDRGMNGRRPMFGLYGPAAAHPSFAALLGGIPLALPGQLGLHDSSVDTEYLGIFGNVDWQLTDRFTLTTGLRWQREEKDAAINNSVTAPGASLISVVLAPAVSPGGAPVNGTLSRRSENISWSFTPQFRVSDTLLGYLTVTRGAKFGGFNTGFGNAPLAAREFGDERITHFELGARGTFAEQRARVSAAAFHTSYEDYQDAAFLSAQFSVGNVGEVELRGVELEGALALGERLSLEVAVSLADLTYARNTTGMCFPGRTPDGTAPRSCDLSGEHPAMAPVWAAHLGAQYGHPVDWGTLYARLDWSWTDEYNTSFSADPRLVQNDYSDVAVRIGAQWGRSYELVLWADNLLDERVSYLDPVLNLFNDLSYQSFLAPSRSYGVTGRVRF